MSAIDTILGYLKASMPFLNSQSSASIVNQMAQAVGLSIDATIAEFANTQTIISNIIGSQRYGRAGYYVSVAKAFQYGDNLIVNPAPNLDPGYAVINSAKQIIKQASYELNNNVGILKIATINNSNSLIPLSLDQLTAFENYFTQFEIPGLPIQIASNVANIISFTETIYYSKTYDLPTIQANVETQEILFQQNFEFNGIFRNTQFSVHLMNNVPGVQDVELSNTILDGATYLGSKELSAGYFNYETITRVYVGI